MRTGVKCLHFYGKILLEPILYDLAVAKHHQMIEILPFYNNKNLTNYYYR